MTQKKKKKWRQLLSLVHLIALKTTSCLAVRGVWISLYCHAWDEIRLNFLPAWLPLSYLFVLPFLCFWINQILLQLAALLLGMQRVIILKASFLSLNTIIISEAVRACYEKKSIWACTYKYLSMKSVLSLLTVIRKCGHLLKEGAGSKSGFPIQLDTENTVCFHLLVLGWAFSVLKLLSKFLVFSLYSGFIIF